MKCARRVVLTVAVLSCVGCAAGHSYPNGPSPTNSPVNWTTSRASLQADDFSLELDGVIFRANVAPYDLRIHSDPGDATYCTLELQWFEHGVEMRVFMYFRAGQGDWWSYVITTYDGKKPAKWVGYRGEDFFRSPLGSSFTANELTMRSNEVGVLRFKNLRLRAFK